MRPRGVSFNKSIPNFLSSIRCALAGETILPARRKAAIVYSRSSAERCHPTAPHFDVRSPELQPGNFAGMGYARAFGVTWSSVETTPAGAKMFSVIYFV